MSGSRDEQSLELKKAILSSSGAITDAMKNILDTILKYSLEQNQKYAATYSRLNMLHGRTAGLSAPTLANQLSDANDIDKATTGRQSHKEDIDPITPGVQPDLLANRLDNTIGEALELNDQLRQALRQDQSMAGSMAKARQDIMGKTESADTQLKSAQKDLKTHRPK